MHYLQPVGVHGFACSCCGDALMPHNAVWICPDCGAIICSECVNTGEVEAHVCEEDE